MKKIVTIVTIATIFLMVVMFATTIVSAATKDSLVNDLYALTSKYGVTNADKVKADRFLTEYPITEDQANQIYGKATEAIKILEDAGVTDVKKLDTQLTKQQKLKFQSLCQEAADIVGVTLTYRNGTAEVYKNGKKIEVFYFTDGKLAYTGNNINIVLVVSSVAVIALATVYIVRKKKTNV